MAMNHPNGSINHHTFTRLLPITLEMWRCPLFASAVGRVHAPCLPQRYHWNQKNHACKPDCPILHNHQRWNNPPTSTRLSMHRRWFGRVSAKNEVRQVKKYLISFCIAFITNSFSGHPWISWACQHASTLITLIAANSKYRSAQAKCKNWWELVLF